ncbi:MAG: hypothetical protein AAF725_15220 [Acidobacteriota bacterium]
MTNPCSDVGKIPDPTPPKFTFNVMVSQAGKVTVVPESITTQKAVDQLQRLYAVIVAAPGVNATFQDPPATFAGNEGKALLTGCRESDHLTVILDVPLVAGKNEFTMNLLVNVSKGESKTTPPTPVSIDPKIINQPRGGG